jgi:hypothetical protein
VEPLATDSVNAASPDVAPTDPSATELLPVDEAPVDGGFPDAQPVSMDTAGVEPDGVELNAAEPMAAQAADTQAAEEPIAAPQPLAATAAPQPLAATAATPSHGGDGLKQNEHDAVFNLVRQEDATHQAVNNGNWRDSATWANGQVPADDARVLINAGVTVTVDNVVPARLWTVRVDGTLRFDSRKDTGLSVDTLVVDPAGRLEMGTSAAPIQQGVRARILFIDPAPVQSRPDLPRNGANLWQRQDQLCHAGHSATSG